jgi:hypothetical protein
VEVRCLDGEYGGVLFWGGEFGHVMGHGKFRWVWTVSVWLNWVQNVDALGIVSSDVRMDRGVD